MREKPDKFDELENKYLIFKIADLQAHNAEQSDALWACRSAVFTSLGHRLKCLGITVLIGNLDVVFECKKYWWWQYYKFDR